MALWEENERKMDEWTEKSRKEFEALKAYWFERDKKWDEKFDRMDEKFDRYDIRLNRLEFLLYLQILGAAALCVVPVIKFYFFGV